MPGAISLDRLRASHRRAARTKVPQSVLLAGARVCVIERRCLDGGVLSAVGLIHSHRWAPADTVLALHRRGPGRWAAR